ncbi:hypothetical protein [Flavisphingomonas formosensis]|uniref:hypothetical protein n=1 Tax=Flavisphingomonas formosensis TaxID=861534 RepID=UPI0012FB8EB3|nr:hypothetical protein [Sphingomonas formosensis]
MEDVGLNAAVSNITAALLGYPAPTITGGQLFKLMREVAPGLNYRDIVKIPKGPGAQTAFIEMYLLGVLERIGNQGGDILYKILGHAEDVYRPRSPELWNAFVTPSASTHIVLKALPDGLVCRRAPAEAEIGEREIAKASSAELDQLRVAFAESLPPEEAARLAGLAPPEMPFADWTSTLRQHAPTTLRKWGAFRREHLARLFAERINALDVDEALKCKAIEQIQIAERNAYERPQRTPPAKAAVAAPGASIGATYRSDHDVIAQARSLAHLAVDGMDYEQLRSLRLPLGVILDALRTK